MRPLNRLEPKLPSKANVTYQIHAPRNTHWRRATCEEFGCLAHRNGWRVRVEGRLPAELHAAKTSGRRYRVDPVAEGETYLVFEAGQACFQAPTHRIRVERPEIFVVRGGDWRRYTGHHTFDGRRAPDNWVDSFATNQDELAKVLTRG